MSKFMSLLVIAFALTACNPGGTSQPGPSPPPPPSYPYNPPASAVASSDPRVPYYGDWVWVVGFADRTTRAGVMSLSSKGDPAGIFLNASGGRALRCVPDLATCNAQLSASGFAVMGTALDAGAPLLASGYAEGQSPNQSGFVVFDDDNSIVYDAEFEGDLFYGSGRWYFSSDPSNSAPIDAFIVQVDAAPSLPLLSTASARSFPLSLPHFGSSSSARNIAPPSPARQAALERLKQMLAAR